MIRAIVSDFGGVLTTPLAGSFQSFADGSGIDLQTMGQAINCIAAREAGMSAVMFRDSGQAIAEMRARLPGGLVV